MAKYWTHPDLGRFKNNFDVAWERNFREPAFKPFRGNTSRFTLSFEIPFNWKDDEPPQPPSEVAVAVAKKVLSRAPKLVPVVLQALWDDFSGIGLSSGMWWENGLVLKNGALQFDIAEVNDGHVPRNSQELLPLLHLCEISIRSSVPRTTQTVAVFCFSAPFEDEHGVGIITDGKEVLGLGYSADCGQYRGEKRSKRKKK